jgi:hypothetical protein
MPFDERYARARAGHELTPVDSAKHTFWCLRCGVLWIERDAGGGARWEIPAQSGRSLATTSAPPCLPSTSVGALHPAGHAALMLHALTHGWRCQPVLLPERGSAEAWRWWREGFFGKEAWSVVGAWRDGPVIDDEVRRQLMTTTGLGA